MVQQSVDGHARQTDIGFEQDQPPRWRQHAPGLAQKGIRRAQVVEHVKEHQVRQAALAEGQFIAIAHQVQPGVWE